MSTRSLISDCQEQKSCTLISDEMVSSVGLTSLDPETINLCIQNDQSRGDEKKIFLRLPLT